MMVIFAKLDLALEVEKVRAPAGMARRKRSDADIFLLVC